MYDADTDRRKCRQSPFLSAARSCVHAPNGQDEAWFCNAVKAAIHANKHGKKKGKKIIIIITIIITTIIDTVAFVLAPCPCPLQAWLCTSQAHAWSSLWCREATQACQHLCHMLSASFTFTSLNS